MTTKAIILLSGGLDSALILAMAIANGRECYAISFDYGQRHRLELRQAQSLARHYNIAHKINRIDASAFANSALVSGLKVPKNRSHAEIASGGIPPTYVPARNTLFLSYALGHAELLKAEEIHYGPNVADAVPYPDCTPDFVHAFQGVMNVATAQAREGKPPKLVAPLLYWDKKKIISHASQLKVPFELTLSCYDPTSLGHHCQLCDACLLRKQGFVAAGIDDPTLYKHIQEIEKEVDV